MFAAFVPETSVLFVSQDAIASGTVASYGLRKRVEAVRGCRSVGKKDMRFNDTMPRMRVDPESYTVEADGKVCTAEPAETLPLTQSWYVY
jgi:urease